MLRDRRESGLMCGEIKTLIVGIEVGDSIPEILLSTTLKVMLS